MFEFKANGPDLVSPSPSPMTPKKQIAFLFKSQSIISNSLFGSKITLDIIDHFFNFPKRFKAPMSRNNDEENALTSNSGPQRRQNNFRFAPQGLVEKDPRRETLCDMLKFSLCPLFVWNSFAVVCPVIWVVVFLVQVSIDGLLVPGSTLSIDASGWFTQKLAMNTSLVMSDCFVYQLVTGLFLHKDGYSLVSDAIKQIFFGSLIESYFGSARMAMLFLLGGALGNLFECILTTEIYMGADPAIMAEIGGMFGFIFLNWRNMAHQDSRQCSMLCTVIVMLIFDLLLLDGLHSFYATFVGFFIGLGLGLFALPHEGSTWEKAMRVTGLLILMGFAATWLLVYFLAYEEIIASETTSTPQPLSNETITQEVPFT